MKHATEIWGELNRNRFVKLDRFVVDWAKSKESSAGAIKVALLLLELLESSFSSHSIIVSVARKTFTQGVVNSHTGSKIINGLEMSQPQITRSVNVLLEKGIFACMRTAFVGQNDDVFKMNIQPNGWTFYRRRYAFDPPLEEWDGSLLLVARSRNEIEKLHADEWIAKIIPFEKRDSWRVLDTIFVYGPLCGLRGTVTISEALQTIKQSLESETLDKQGENNPCSSMNTPMFIDEHPPCSSTNTPMCGDVTPPRSQTNTPDVHKCTHQTEEQVSKTKQTGEPPQRIQRIVATIKTIANTDPSVAITLPDGSVALSGGGGGRSIFGSVLNREPKLASALQKLLGATPLNVLVTALERQYGGNPPKLPKRLLMKVAANFELPSGLEAELDAWAGRLQAQQQHINSRTQNQQRERIIEIASKIIICEHADVLSSLSDRDLKNYFGITHPFGKRFPDDILASMIIGTIMDAENVGDESEDEEAIALMLIGKFLAKVEEVQHERKA